jgi:hypothetical protein
LRTYLKNAQTKGTYITGINITLVIYGTLALSSVTFLIRGIDPDSQRGTIPKGVNNFFLQFSTAILYIAFSEISASMYGVLQAVRSTGTRIDPLKFRLGLMTAHFIMVLFFVMAVPVTKAVTGNEAKGYLVLFVGIFIIFFMIWMSALVLLTKIYNELAVSFERTGVSRRAEAVRMLKWVTGVSIGGFLVLLFQFLSIVTLSTKIDDAEWSYYKAYTSTGKLILSEPSKGAYLQMLVFIIGFFMYRRKEKRDKAAKELGLGSGAIKIVSDRINNLKEKVVSISGRRPSEAPKPNSENSSKKTEKTEPTPVSNSKRISAVSEQVASDTGSVLHDEEKPPKSEDLRLAIIEDAAERSDDFK